jgi:acetate---CoA ligase (ADP-forming)
MNSNLDPLVIEDETSDRPALRAMLEARSVAVVGASARAGSFGERVRVELERSPSRPRIHLINPRYSEIAGHACVPSLADLAEPVDLVLFAVGDQALEEQFELAARRGDRSAVIFGSVVDQDDPFATGPTSLRGRIAARAREHGMAVCGGGCMGFVNVSQGLRAIGYLERDPLPAGPVACITHSGSVFSAILRADRRLGWTTVVSSGQELATTTAEYLEYALELEDTRVVALLLETVRDPARLIAALRQAAAQDVPVVMLAVGGSPAGRAMVAAHSGALAGDDAAWEALCEATGVIRVDDLGGLLDTLELFAAGRRAPSPAERGVDGPLGLATVHDSGAERTLVADVAHELGVTFAPLRRATQRRLADLLDPGLEVTNPLDVWGRGADTADLFTASLLALAGEPATGAVAMCVDLVPEYDGDQAYRTALRRAWSGTGLPVCLITNMPSALDRVSAAALRADGIPILEGTYSGVAAVGHLLSWQGRRADALAAGAAAPKIDASRRERWRERLRAGRAMDALESIELLSDYGLRYPLTAVATSREEALAAAERIGYPLVLKTDNPDISHKSDVGGVVLDVGSAVAVAEAYDRLAARLGPRVIVAEMADEGVELALGIVNDPMLGPVVVVGAGGILVEVIADRFVALPPIDEARAARLLAQLKVAPLLAGARGRPGVDTEALVGAVTAMSQLAVELGPDLRAVDVNPLRCSERGVIALDALVEAAVHAG